MDYLNKIVDDEKLVKGVIYVIEHTASGKKYVGQTVTHRKNHNRYRPFGAAGRFSHHVSEAICNTKHKSGHLLGTDIRAYGKDAFTVSTIELCDKSVLDEREIYHITALNTIYPQGYNLTKGGKGCVPVAIIKNETPLSQPKERGGCESRSAETREKISQRLQERGYSTDERQTRAANASAQHLIQKKARFAEVKVDPSRVNEYIKKYKGRIMVDVDGVTSFFDGKNETEEKLKERAKEFLLSLVPATLPNCSGNP